MRIVAVVLILLSGLLNAQDSYFLKSSDLNGIQFRNIGPALTAGRISDIAVNDKKPGEYFITIASGGVFKTSNWGNTFIPVFDNYGSYSVGCITIDPHNPNRIWLGSGENNNQRSVGYGDGVYVSNDGGNSWKNVGLKESEHIHKIIVHPNPDSSDVIFVAAAGPLWKDGGERGVYKSSDGGKTWNRMLYISEMTGVADLIMDPRDPNVMYAAAHQRRRHVWTYIGGGPESAIYKTTNGGVTWNKINKGLPGVDIGRIGLAISPANPEYLYAIVEAAQGKGGFFRSLNRGASWEKRSGYSTSGNYYQEIVCHPYNPDIVYSMNTWLHHTEDGGKTFKQTGEKQKHVDNHCMWIDPDNTDHWLVGCDGGLYETWDAAQNWHYKPNLPITQFYKVSVDNDLPFYNVYGGTQDNNSLGGPSRTTNTAGILNSDWYITNGGDGFESQIDPKNPDIVYAQAQYGWLVRFDRKSGEKTAIQPQPGKDEDAYRWNWDAPLIISPHDNKRLYFAANKLFRSDDRGDTWKVISPDLTRDLDRNELPVMGRIWSVDAVMKNKSTTIYGNITALDESPLKEGLLYVGTDDGLIQVSEDGGNNWRKEGSFKDVPERTYVNQIIASQHDEDVAYAVFNNHKNGDFKPYVYQTTNGGKSWKPINGNLPDRGTVYTIAEDHVNKDILFVGTEFGCYVTLDGGTHWVKLSGGLPTIAIKDIAIQRRENDLVLASFGRGVYILDDYSFLREATPKVLRQEAHLFSADTALMYIEKNPLGLSGVGSQGASHYAAENPPVGAVFTFHLKDVPKSMRDQRREEEAEDAKKGLDNKYPELDELRAEDQEDEPYLLFVVTDENDRPIKKMRQSPKKGINRFVWNFRTATTTPIKLNKEQPGRYGMADDGYMVIPGTYKAKVYVSENGEFRQITDPVEFVVEPLNHQTLPAEDKEAMVQFMSKVSQLRRRVRGASNLHGETSERLQHVKKAVELYPTVPLEFNTKVRELELALDSLQRSMWGDPTLSSREFETKDGLASRIEFIVWSAWNSFSAPTTTSKRNLDIAKEEFEPWIIRLHELIREVKDLETRLNVYEAPYTPGRGESWKKE